MTTNNHTIYLAASYSRREELCKYRDELTRRGWRVRARWLDGTHQLPPAGTTLGDAGEALVEAGGPEAHALRGKFAKDDVEDVLDATIVISFTGAGGRGGRHVEFGIAITMGACLIVVGPREHIFHSLPGVRQYDDWGQCLSLEAF